MATTTGFGVTQTIAIDLAKPGIPKMVYAMQGEGYTRTVSLRISDDGVQWTPPSDAAYQVSYCKPDGKGGTYSSYTTDSTKPAVEISGGRLNVVLIPQMLQVAGRVRVEVHMQHAAIMEYAERLSTFTFYVMVQASAESGVTSTDYWAAALNDKIVLLTEAVLATAGTQTAYPDLSVFLATPHKGDTVVGTNGYTAIVTKLEGTTVTLQSTGKRWTAPASGVAAQDVSYSATIDGTSAANVKAALDALAARQGVLAVNATYNATTKVVSADRTYAQIAAAVGQKKSVICIVTSGITATSIMPLVSLTSAAAIFGAPIVNDGVLGINSLILAKDTGVWRIRKWEEQALCFTDEADIPTTQGETKQMGGYAMWPRVPEMGELVVGSNGYTGQVTELDDDGDPVITASGKRIFTFDAPDITYSGTVGTQTVGSVKAALDALAIGNPLDMSADFVARGKDDISDWAVEAAAGSTTEYRIAPGIYQIQLASGASDKTIVTIIDDTVSNKRLVKQERITDEGFYQLYIGTASAPGVYSEDIVFGTDDGVVSINNRQATLPWYNTSDAGKVPVVEGNFVKWKNLMPQIEITLSSGESPAITSVTKDGVSVGSTAAEWANAVHEAVQKNWPIAFVLGNTHYRPSDVQWDDTSTMLQYLYFSGPSDISQFFQICVWLYTDGRAPEITTDDQL